MPSVNRDYLLGVKRDYLPIVSTVDSAYYLQHKVCCTPNYTEGNISKALYDERVQNKSWTRCAFLLVPIVVNNIFVALLDLCLSYYGNSLLNRAKSLQTDGQFHLDNVRLKYLSLLRWAAFVGNTEAFTLLARDDEKLPLKTRMQHLKRAASEEDAQALLELGHTYFRGDRDASITVAANPKIAGEFYELSANLGNIEAQCLVGDYYQNDYVGVFKIDNEKGAQFYQLAANQGSADGQYKLGRCYQYGTGVKENSQEAVKFYQLGADQGCSEAQIALASLLEKGTKEVAKDENRAFQLYQLAAKQNDSWAMCAVGRCFEKGIGVKQNNEEAFKAYQSAVILARYNSEAQNALGRCYAYGIGVQQDLKQAWELLTKEKDFYTDILKDKDPDTEILLQLGKDCAEGRNRMKKDLFWAYQCYHKLVDAALDKRLSAKEAKYRLGRLYLDNGNISLARIYLKAADEAWHPKAKKWLDKLPPEQAPRS